MTVTDKKNWVAGGGFCRNVAEIDLAAFTLIAAVVPEAESTPAQLAKV
jgi:hypothetical protein